MRVTERAFNARRKSLVLRLALINDFLDRGEVKNLGDIFKNRNSRRRRASCERAIKLARLIGESNKTSDAFFIFELLKSLRRLLRNPNIGFRFTVKSCRFPVFLLSVLTVANFSLIILNFLSLFRQKLAEAP